MASKAPEAGGPGDIVNGLYGLCHCRTKTIRKALEPFEGATLITLIRPLGTEACNGYSAVLQESRSPVTRQSSGKIMVLSHLLGGVPPELSSSRWGDVEGGGMIRSTQ